MKNYFNFLNNAQIKGADVIKFKIIFTVISLIILLVACKTENPKTIEVNNNEYMAKYAGGYTIQVIGHISKDDAEAYALNKNGRAKWMYIVNDGLGNAKVMSEKDGSWTAEEGKIKIIVQGNTGPIEEDYILKNGRFVNTLINDRYLLPTK